MNGRIVQRIFRLRNPHESGRLLKSKCADPADIPDLFAAQKDPLTFPAFHNVFGNPSAESGDMRKQRCACRIEIHSRSEEHTSELQSRFDLVCRLLLEKKKADRNEYSHE